MYYFVTILRSYRLPYVLHCTERFARQTRVREQITGEGDTNKIIFSAYIIPRLARRENIAKEMRFATVRPHDMPSHRAYGRTKYSDIGIHVSEMTLSRIRVQ